MTSVGINAASLETQTASFVSVSMSQVTVTASQSFSNVLKGSMTNSQQNADAIRTYKDIRPNPGKDEVVKASTPVSAKEEVRTNNTDTKDGIAAESPTDAQLAGTKADNTAAVSKDAKTAGSIEEPDIDDCVKAIEVLNTLMQGIAELLNTSIEELQGCYEQLDLQPSQMFTVTSIQLTVVTIEGLTDTSDLLVNNDAFDMFNKIMDLVQSVLSDAGMDLSQFENILKGDAFADFVGPLETGNIGELLGKFSFDENGRLIVENKNEDDSAAANEAIGEEPFAVEVNIEKTTENENSKDSGSSFEKSPASAGTKTQGAASKTTVSAAESFIQGLENATPVTDIDMPVAEGVTVRDIVYQIVDAIRVNISEESTSLEMNLNPENLGRVNLNIQSRDGVMTAQITDENDVARAAIESQLQILKDNIEAQGVRVEAIEVTVSSFSFSDSRNSQSEAREHPEDGVRVGRNARAGQTQGEEAESVQAQEKLEQEVMEQNGSTVNFVA